MARLLWLAKPRHDQSQGCNNSLLMLPAEDRWILVTNSSACDLAINLRGIHLLDDLGSFGKFKAFLSKASIYVDDSISKLRIKMRKQNCLRNICPKSVDFFGGMCIRRWNPPSHSGHEAAAELLVAAAGDYHLTMRSQDQITNLNLLRKPESVHVNPKVNIRLQRYLGPGNIINQITATSCRMGG